MADTRMTLMELADRLEKATGPDRELEWQVFRAIRYPDHLLNKDPANWHITTRGSVTEPVRSVAFEGFNQAPRYTASLDAAMTLVPEGWAYKIGRNWCELWPMHPDVSDDDWPEDCNEDRQHYGKTPRLALLPTSLPD